jgi:hypothetical protein
MKRLLVLAGLFQAPSPALIFAPIQTDYDEATEQQILAYTNCSSTAICSPPMSTGLLQAPQLAECARGLPERSDLLDQARMLKFSHRTQPSAKWPLLGRPF